MDGDGDLDILVGAESGELVYFRNSGTATSPAFAGASTNPFGLTLVSTFSKPTFGDLDGDGDLDLLVGRLNGNFVYFQNTGTALAPAFAASTTNPFGLVDVGTASTPALGDLDIDGDLDALVGENDGNWFYFRNTGTALAPAFAASSSNPFGLTDVGDNSGPAFADLNSGDGDLDVLSGTGTGDFVFFHGSPSTPTAVVLTDFSAIAHEQNARITLKWATGSELNLIGFNIWRRTRGKEWVKLNDELIPARNVGAPTGAGYRYQDKRLDAGRYKYKIEIVNATNTSEWSSIVRAKLR